jgi:hypothetical protein
MQDARRPQHRLMLPQGLKNQNPIHIIPVPQKPGGIESGLSGP